MESFISLVPSTGFEPARLATPPPQDGVSTNFTNWAIRPQRYNFRGSKDWNYKTNMASP